MNMQANRSTLVNALRAAADAYKKDARLQEPWPRIAEQFKKQADECVQIAEQIEQADSVTLHD